MEECRGFLDQTCLSPDPGAPDAALPERFQPLNQTTGLVFCYIQISVNQLIYTPICKIRDKNSTGISTIDISGKKKKNWFLEKKKKKCTDLNTFWADLATL